MLEAIESESKVIEVCGSVTTVCGNAELGPGLSNVKSAVDVPFQEPMQTKECDSLSTEEPFSQSSLRNGSENAELGLGLSNLKRAIDVSFEEPMQTKECDSVSVEEALSESPLCNEMLDYLAQSVTAHFKSQQVNEPELDPCQKREIAKDLLVRSPAQFLCRFGRHVELKHLEYFSSMKENDYEITFYLQQLERFHCKSTKQVDVKNRRFEALKKLLKEGTYFSETEMKNRNPLLYEQLIGQYLTQHEIEERQQAAMVINSTLVSVLLAQIEQEQTNKLRQKQKDDEKGAEEEMDTSENESDEGEETESEAEMSSHGNSSDFEDEQEREKPSIRRKVATHAEKELFREEFYSFMYNSFLEGKDVDFDYGQVDLNPDFECLSVLAQDAEEKYFDSETPEEPTCDAAAPPEQEAVSEEDELDVFMKTLKADPTPTELAGQIQEL